MNPYLSLIVLRAGFFILPLGVLSLLKVPAPIAVAAAAVISVVLSALFLREQRRRVGQRLIQRAGQRVKGQDADTTTGAAATTTPARAVRRSPGKSRPRRRT
jgi:membrane protein implicated in regulation of membrane protease activity